MMIFFGFAAFAFCLALMVAGIHASEKMEHGGSAVSEDDPTAGFSDDAVDSVALDKVWGRLPRFNYSKEQCESTLRRAAELREEFANEPLRLRRKIMSWISWYEKEARDDLRELEKKAHANALRQHLAEQPPNRSQAAQRPAQAQSLEDE